MSCPFFFSCCFTSKPVCAKHYKVLCYLTGEHAVSVSFQRGLRLCFLRPKTVPRFPRSNLWSGNWETFLRSPVLMFPINTLLLFSWLQQVPSVVFVNRDCCNGINVVCYDQIYWQITHQKTNYKQCTLVPDWNHNWNPVFQYILDCSDQTCNMSGAFIFVYCFSAVDGLCHFDCPSARVCDNHASFVLLDQKKGKLASSGSCFNFWL